RGARAGPRRPRPGRALLGGGRGPGVLALGAGPSLRAARYRAGDRTVLDWARRPRADDDPARAPRAAARPPGAAGIRLRRGTVPAVRVVRLRSAASGVGPAA